MEPSISLERGQAKMIVYNQSCQNALDADSRKSVLWLCAGIKSFSEPRENAAQEYN